MSARSQARRAQRKAKEAKRWGQTKNARPGRETRSSVEKGDQPEYLVSRPLVRLQRPRD